MGPNAKIFAALMLGVVAFFLLFALGEGVRIPPSVPAAPFVKGAIFVGGMGLYFLLCAFWLTRGDTRSLLRLWPIIVALGAPLLATVLIALVVEPNKAAVAEVAAVWLLGVLCSWIGAWLGGRAKHV